MIVIMIFLKWNFLKEFKNRFATTTFLNVVRYAKRRAKNEIRNQCDKIELF